MSPCKLGVLKKIKVSLIMAIKVMAVWWRGDGKLLFSQDGANLGQSICIW